MGDNIFATGMAAFGNAYEQQNKFRTDRAQIQAGRQIAGGDYTSGAATLNSAGMIDAGHNVIADQQQLQDRQSASDTLAAKQKAAALINVAQSLKQVPMGQRKAALQSKLPIFQAMKIDTAALDGLDEAHLADDQLDQFSTALGKAADEYTLSEGQQRIRDGKVIASGAPKPQEYLVLPEGAKAVPKPNAGQTVSNPAAAPATAEPTIPTSGAGAPRGLRNNNPLNVTSLPHGQWDGQTGQDGQYAVFATPEQGVAAADKNLQAYGKLHGINTLSGIIQRWAPPSENDTGSYISTVSKTLGIDPNQPLNLADPTVRRQVLGAMARVELGKSGTAPTPAAPAAPQGQAADPPGTLYGNPKPGEGEGLTDDAVQLLAGRYLKDGTLPPLGMGQAAAAARQKILNSATKMAKELGVDAGDLVAGTLDIKASGAALNKVTSNLAVVRSFEQTALRNADLALSLAPKGAAPLNVPILNRWVQTGRKAVMGDPSVTQFDIALGTFLDEYAKIVSGATGGQGSTDASRKEAYERLSKYATQGQLAAGFETMKKEMHNRTGSMEDVQEGLRAHIRGGAAVPSAAPAASAPAAAPQPAAPPRKRPPLSAIFG